MSKAFTKESDDESGLEAELDASVPGGKNFITPAGARRLQEELDRLSVLERPEQLRALQLKSGVDSADERAALDVKRKLREIDRRIRFLTKRLEAVEIIDPAKVNSDQVRFGATVTILDSEGDQKQYAIVGIDEADAGRRRISWLSPLARALIQNRVGDVVTVPTPGGAQEVEIVKIEYIGIEDLG